MDWDKKLIALYLVVCKAYEEKIGAQCQRLTNGGYKRLTDQEVMTMYLLGTLLGLNTMKAIHGYIQAHWLHYFPEIGGYAAFAHRVARLGPAFNEFVIWLQEQKINDEDERVYLLDSYPIMIAKHQHAYRAKVAQGVASTSYCATKKLYYYGVKAHMVARKNTGALPDMECCIIDEAAKQDGPCFDRLLRPHLRENLVFADQAYRRSDADKVEQAQGLKVFTPIQKPKGKALSREQKAFSKAVASMRQPIEAFFAWIDRVTQIQNASRVRSVKGLITHIFGKLSAALTLRLFPQLDF